jgi:1-acyl-sn-glycerol-3-phosphate acyltransferase
VSAIREALRRAWGYAVLGTGFALLAIELFAWALAAVPLMLLLPAPAGRRLGRIAAMWGFRGYLAAMEFLGAWRLDLRELDQLRDAGPLILAPNHPCLLDAVLIVSRLPNVLCVMKGSLVGNFLLGPAARLARYLRNDKLRFLATAAASELEAGGQLLIFPEATRTTGGALGPLTEAVGAISRRSAVPVQALIIEAGTPFLSKGASMLARPELPLAFRVRLGRRFEPPQDVRAFTLELERHFQRELALPVAPLDGATLDGAVEEAPRAQG